MKTSHIYRPIYKSLNNVLTGKYIWRTQNDGNVRESHADNRNKIFFWDQPPITGHPGNEYGCRCWAEPLDGDEYAYQHQITPINDNPYQWSAVDFAQHYFFGNGTKKTLHEIGHLRGAIEHYSKTLRVYDRVNRQIIDKAIKAGEGSFTYDFIGSYEFGPVTWELAESTVGGLFLGSSRKEGEFLIISGIITYYYYDDFADPFQIVEFTQLIFGVDREIAINFLEQILGVNVEFAGTPFPITDTWMTKFNATVRIAP